LEYGGEYFNLETFPDGEAKTDLLRVMNKRMGKRFDGDSGPVEKPKREKRKAVASGRNPIPGPPTTYTVSYQ